MDCSEESKVNLPMPQFSSTADFIQRVLLDRHNSTFTGGMVMDVEHWYGIPALAFLVVTGAETSLGDPVLGGPLAKTAFNYGCLKFGSRFTKWGELSLPDPMVIRGIEWFQFATPILGVMALGRYLKVGPRHLPGFYLSLFSKHPTDWRAFSEVYYGSSVTGIGDYVKNLETLADKFKVLAAASGFGW